MFYANHCTSTDDGELAILVQGIKIIVNNFLFEKVFDTKFSGIVPFMNGIWPKNLKVTFEETKAVVVEPDVDLSNFGPLSLCFKIRILAHIITTNLTPKKGSLIKNIKLIGLCGFVSIC